MTDGCASDIAAETSGRSRRIPFGRDFAVDNLEDVIGVVLSRASQRSAGGAEPGKIKDLAACPICNRLLSNDWGAAIDQ